MRQRDVADDSEFTVADSHIRWARDHRALPCRVRFVRVRLCALARFALGNHPLLVPSRLVRSKNPSLKQIDRTGRQIRLAEGFWSVGQVLLGWLAIATSPAFALALLRLLALHWIP